MAKIVGYYHMPVSGFGSEIPASYFRTPTLDPFYPGWKREPIPGWGARPSMAGPRMVAVGQEPVSSGGGTTPSNPSIIDRFKQLPESRRNLIILVAGVATVGLVASIFTRRT